MRVTMPARPRAVALLAAGGLTALLLCGCGPEVPLDVAVRQLNVDVHHQLTPTPTPAAAPTPTPTVTLPPLPAVAPPVVPLPPEATPVPTAAPTAVPTAAPAAACATAPQLGVPAQEASATVPGPPTPSTYQLRYAGTEGLGAPGSTPGTRLGPALQRTVAAAPAPATQGGQAAAAWTVTQTDGQAQEAWVFQLFQPTSSPLATAAGVYVAGLEWKDAVRGNLSFAPTTGPLELLPLPVSSGQQYASTATDASSHTTISLTGTVNGRQKVDACGTWVDSWTVAITGTISSPNQQLQWSATYQVATQFGGLVVADHVTLSGPDSAASLGQELSFDASSTIDVVPAATAGGPQ